MRDDFEKEDPVMHPVMHDLHPAVDRLSTIVSAVKDDQLDAPTPCRDTTVGALLDHVDGLALAFTAAATKAGLESGAPSADASRLPADWRSRIPARLAALADAWADDEAWQGMTRAGGLDLPAEIAGVVALDEVVVHGWDLARATGQPFDVPPDLLEAVHGFARATAQERPGGTPGLFGPPVPVPDDAPLVDRTIGLTGRDPAWRPPS